LTAWPDADTFSCVFAATGAPTHQCFHQAGSMRRFLSQKCNGARRSPRSGRKSKAHGASRGYRLRALGQPAKRAEDPSQRRRFLGSEKGSLCGRRQSVPPLRAAHRQRTPWASLFRPLRGLHHLNCTFCPPRLAPWAFIYRPLRGLARIRARALNLPVEPPLTNGVLGPAMKARRVWQERAGSLPGGGGEFIEGKALLSHPLSLHFLG